MSSGDERPRPPRDIRVRLADVPRHLNALRYALDVFPDEDAYAEAARAKDPEVLLRVYAVERPFELLDNYAVELAKLGLEAAGLRDANADMPASACFRLLRDEGAIGKELCERLVDVHELRNQLAHEYPDVRGRRIYLAARELDLIVRDYFRRYLKWLAALGFDVPQV